MKIDFEKGNGLVPAIIQDADTSAVLMLGYMNEAALEETKRSGRVCFFSRSKNRLWTKGERSGNYLTFVELTVDCDADTLLIQTRPEGPTCHTGSQSCFGDDDRASLSIISSLEKVISERLVGADAGSSYTAALVKDGIARVAQKVGEEGVEVALAAALNKKEDLHSEAADLIYHLLVLLKISGSSLSDVLKVLAGRAKKNNR